MQQIFRGLLVAFVTLSLPLWGAAQTQIAQKSPTSKVQIAMEGDFLIVSVKNLRELSLQEPNGKTVISWKAAKRQHHNKIRLDVRDLANQPYLVNVRYGTERYAKLLRFDDLAVRGE